MSREIGPELPPGFNLNRNEEGDDNNNEESEEIGPELPPGFNANINDKESDDDSEDDFIGPRPPGANDVADEESAQSLFEFKCRMTERKKKQAADASEDSSARPEWMTKVPRDRTGAFGTGARSFRMTSAPEVDSSWEEKGGHVGKHKRQREPSAQQGPQHKVQRVEASTNAPAVRQKSLLEEHMELMKKGKAKTMSDEPPPGYWTGMGSRGPERNSYFDRERDFAVSQMDPTQLKKTLDSVGKLKDSFSSAGKSNNFM